MTHLKRLVAPKSWPLPQRKGISFVARPNPGAHAITQCMTLNGVLIYLLKFAKTAREVRNILNQDLVLVNQKVRRDPHHAVGLFDIISFVTLKKHYRVLYNQKGKFTVKEITEPESKQQLVKIIGKTLLKKSKLQLNFSNGSNLLIEKDGYRVGDSLILEDHKIKKVLKMEKGCTI